MDVVAVVSVVILKLTDLLNLQSIVFNKLYMDDVRWVEGKLTAAPFIRDLKDAEDKQYREKGAKKWVEDFLVTVYDLENVIDTIVLQTTNLRKKCVVKNNFIVNKLKARNLPMEMRRIKKKITKLEEDAESILRGNRQSQHQQAIVTSTPDLEEELNITAFKEHVERMVSDLTDPVYCPHRVFSIVHKNRSTKTILAMTIYNHRVIKKHFQCRAWVFVSEEVTETEILLIILRQIITLKKNEKLTDHDEIKKRLHQCLREKRYLIVMDDVLTPNVWQELQGAFPTTPNGSSVIFTTGKRDDSFVDARRCLQIDEPLNDRHSCELFFKELGGLLSTKNVRYEEGSTDLEHHIWERNGRFSNIVALSYNDLSVELRLCFLYLGLFPKNYKIPVRRLFRLWLAEGFVKQLSETETTREELAERFLTDLVNKNMIQIASWRSDGNPKTCHMHGVLYDFFLSKAVDIGLFHIHGTSSTPAPPQFGIRRLIEHAAIKDYPHSEEGNIQYLRSFISFNIQEKDTPAIEVGNFLSRIIRNRGFGFLRVLDLERVYKPRLAEKLGNLFHLRYLGLRWTFLDNLPSYVGDLPYLETLDVKHTYISTLPSSIWKMKCLRHLCLNDNRLDMPVQNSNRSSLTQLHTLWGLFVDRESPVKNGLDRLTNLRKLGLTCHHKSVQQLVKWIVRLTHLQSLRLRSKDEMGRPSELQLVSLSDLGNLSNLYLLGKLQRQLDEQDFPPKLRVLTLSVSQLRRDPMPTLAQLPSLSVLRLLANSYTGRRMSCPVGFHELRILKLWMLKELEYWTVEEGAMENLQELEIRQCTNLKKFPETLLQMRNMEELILRNMPTEFVTSVEVKMPLEFVTPVENVLGFSEWKFSTKAT